MTPTRPAESALLLLALLLTGACDRGGTERDAEEAVQSPAAAEIPEGRETAVALDSETIRTIGLETRALQPSHRGPERELTAEVIADPGAGVTIRAGVSGRLSSVGENQWPRLGEHLDAGTPVGRIGDGVPVLVPRSGTVTAVLAQLGELVQAGQGILLLTDYSTALIRVVQPADGSPVAERLEISLPGDTRRFTARLAGPADSADPLTRAPAWLYRAAGATELRPGVGLIAFAPDPRAPAGGLLVPAEAVVQWDALAWAFVERSPGHFVRVRVPTDFPVPGGWLAGPGFRRGDRVVTRAAGQLLSEEFRAHIVVGEEVGE